MVKFANYGSFNVQRFTFQVNSSFIDRAKGKMCMIIIKNMEITFNVKR